MNTIPILANIKKQIAKVAAIDFTESSEQATREMAVNPVIGALGWDTFNPSEVAREFSVLGGRVDYCLRGQSGNLVLIEVKSTGTDLTKHQEQLLRYAFEGGVELAVLTDGLIWWLYLPMASGRKWEQRRFSRIDLREDNAASNIYRFLSRDDVVGGAALEEARQEFESQERDRSVRAALEEAWRRVLDDPNSLLRDLLAETVKEISGHMPNREIIADFLGEIGKSRIPEADPPPSLKPSLPRLPPSDATVRRIRKPSIPPAAFWLNGKRHKVAKWRTLLLQVCEQLVKEVGPAVFAERVAGNQTRRHFSASSEKLRTPLKIPGADFFVEGKNSAQAIERIAKRTLVAVRGSDAGFSVELGKQERSAKDGSR